MNHLHQHRIRISLLAGTTVIAIGLLGGAATAQAAPCVVGPGVTQNETMVIGTPGDDTIDCTNVGPGKTINGNAGNDTITGTAFADTINGGDGNDTITGGAGNDTLNGGLGIDTISGSDGNDNLVGPSNDGSSDSLDGGLGTDTCQGPAPDPDTHASCENTATPPATGSGSGTANATQLCQTTGGTFSITVIPVGYACVFPFSPGSPRITEASNICTGSGGTFVNALPVSYACLLPKQAI